MVVAINWERRALLSCLPLFPLHLPERTLEKGKMMREPVIRARIIVEVEKAEPVGYDRLSH